MLVEALLAERARNRVHQIVLADFVLHVIFVHLSHDCFFLVRLDPYDRRDHVIAVLTAFRAASDDFCVQFRRRVLRAPFSYTIETKTVLAAFQKTETEVFFDNILHTNAASHFRRSLKEERFLHFKLHLLFASHNVIPWFFFIERMDNIKSTVLALRPVNEFTIFFRTFSRLFEPRTDRSWS